MLRIDPSLPDDEGFVLNGNDDQLTITAHREIGLLYGAYEALRLQATDVLIKDEQQHPKFKLRLLNHWDNHGWLHRTMPCRRVSLSGSS